MIINLTKSTLFTVDPAIRFAKEYNIDKKIFEEMLRRHWLLHYKSKDVADYFELKTGKKIPQYSITRWMNLADVYARGNHVLTMGVRAVDTAYFNDFEPFVIKEFLKNMRYSNKKDSRIVV